MNKFIYSFLLFTFLCSNANAGFFDFLQRSSLPQFSTSDASIQSLRCPLYPVDKSQTRQAYIEDIFEYSTDYRSYNYGYFAFENQSQEAVDIFRELFSNSRPKSLRGCKSVKCVLANSFGDKWPYYVYLLKRYNINASPYAVDSTQRWTDRELMTVLQTLQNLPQHLFPQPNTIHIVHNNVNTENINHHGNIGTFHTSSDVIRVYSPWDRSSQKMKVSYLTHELAHSFGDNFNLHFGNEWKITSNWTLNKKGVFEAKNKKTLTSRYSSDGPEEDFAEAFTAFRYNPNHLLNLAPEKFNYLKNVIFGGLDYTNASNCRPKRNIYQLDYPEQYTDESAVDKKCEFELIKYRVGKATIEDYIGCFESNFHKITIASDLGQLPIDAKYLDIMERNFVNYPQLSYQLNQTTFLNDLYDMITQFY